MKMERRQCSICGDNALARCWGEEEASWGNNAHPVNAGRCCDQCNALVVLPARLAKLNMVRHRPHPSKKEN